MNNFYFRILSNFLGSLQTVRFRGDFGRFYLIWLYGGGKARYLLLCGNRKAPHRCGAFALPGRWNGGCSVICCSTYMFSIGRCVLVIDNNRSSNNTPTLACVHIHTTAQSSTVSRACVTVGYFAYSTSRFRCKLM